MTPTELEDIARVRYNAVGDSFFPQDMIFNLMFNAQMELAVKAKAIERIYTTTSVASQQAYSYPDQTIMIKRVTFDGAKLSPINMREDDVLTLFDQATTATGTPTHYFIWNRQLYLRDIPATAGLTIRIFSYNKPQAVTSTSTLEVPEEFHFNMVDYILAHFFAKDKDLNMFRYYMDRWDNAVIDAKRYFSQRKRADSFGMVQDEDSLPRTILGW